MTEPVDLGGRGPLDGPSVLRFDGVTLTGPDPGRPPVGGLALECDEHGVTILGPAAGAARTVWWSGVDGAWCGDPATVAPGVLAVPLEITSDARTVRFLLPWDGVHAGRSAELSRRLPGWLAGAHRDRPSPTPWPESPWPESPPGGRWPPAPQGAARRTRRRRRAAVSAALVVALAWTGVTVAAVTSGGRPAPVRAGTAPPSPDQQLADQLMLTQNDLPGGWRADTSPAPGTTPGDLRVERQIDQAFVACMGVTDSQGSMALGGPAADQTAQSSSPIFVGPNGPGSAPGTAAAVELQTAATIVRSHQDEVSDFSLFSSPKFPGCDATAIAAETQLGLNDVTGASEQAGPAASSPVAVPSFAGEQLVGLQLTFDVGDGTTRIPVVVDQVVVGSDRIEAQLQTFAIGAPFPSAVLTSSVSTFEQRVAAQGGTTSA